MQVWPQFKNLPNRTLLTALSMSALSSIITGHFPPNYNKQGVKFFAASIATSFPVYVEPVKHIKSKGSDVSFFATLTLP